MDAGDDVLKEMGQYPVIFRYRSRMCRGVLTRNQTSPALRAAYHFDYFRQKKVAFFYDLEELGPVVSCCMHYVK